MRNHPKVPAVVEGHDGGRPSDVGGYASSTVADALDLLPPDLTVVRAFRRLDPETQMHLRRVSALSGELASFLGLPRGVQRQARIAGLLHDIGKSVVPGSILHKPAPLARGERTVLRLHPGTGASLVWSLGDPVVLDAVRHHHERLDGKGYPDGLAAEHLGDVTRLVTITDVYDALVSERPYRAALPAGEALCRMTDVAGTQLDAEMLDALIMLRSSASSRAA